jgi:N-methylhydantoinase A/oxoprolinase/acetone carboxylase beta subunit
VITLDVGGTSADIGLAQEGRLRMKHLLDTRVGPYQAMIPMVDVDTIGAGGGLDRVRGRRRDLPRRAALGGCRPGPGRIRPRRHRADRYRRDGQPRWLLPEDVPRRRMSLDADAARRAFEEGPARRST